MIDWGKVEKAHVINTFRKVAYKWWGIDLRFFDESANWQSTNLKSKNPVCGLLGSGGNKGNDCKKNYKKHMKYLAKYQKPFFYKCFAGLQGVIVPIIVNGKYVGGMVGCGIYSFKAQIGRRQQYLRKLKVSGFDIEEVERSYDELKDVNGHIMEYLLDFMKLVADDVMSLYETLLEKDDIIKRQTALLEKAYNSKYKGIVSVSPSMKEVFDTLELVENNESPVLIEGESGTGKELLAAAVHYNSPRRDKIFVIQNCSAFSETLLSSELFGHESGAFTGAISAKKGLFEIADGGTLFLDEIGDMNLEVQAKVLRVLEGGTFYSVGGTVPRKVNIRIIAATNKKLKREVEEGLFRKDLLFRINAMHISVPPLRERNEDVILIADYFLETYAVTHNTKKKELSREVVELFLGHKWPGNVRQLKNVIERSILISGKDKMITLKHLSKEIRDDTLQTGDFVNTADSNLRNALHLLEKKLIENELKIAGWNKTVVSKRLGISRASINNKIEMYNIKHDPGL